MGRTVTEERLRMWVHGELSPEERRETTRWIVRCTDPDLSSLLQGMIQERRERSADDALRQHGSWWRVLVERWGALLDAGSAAWMAPGGGLALASAETEPPWLEAEVTATELTIRVRPDDHAEVAVYVSTDAPAVRALVAPADASSLSWPQVLAPPSADRPTLWAVRGSRLPRRPAAAEELIAALSDPRLEALSVRWDPRDL